MTTVRCSRIAVPCTHHAFTPRPDPSLHLAPPDSTRRAHPEYSLAKHHNILTFRTTNQESMSSFMRRSLHDPVRAATLQTSGKQRAASGGRDPEVTSRGPLTFTLPPPVRISHGRAGGRISRLLSDADTSRRT